MVERDVILAKIDSIQNCLDRIDSVVAKDPHRLDTLDGQDIVTLNLQRAIQLTIDIASHIISTEKLGLPQSLRDTFLILQKKGVIDEVTCALMSKMVGFRNIAFHDYQTIDPAILHAVVNNHLGDFERFYTAVLKKFPG